MKSHIADGSKLICYSGPDDAAEVTWSILDDHNVNQFMQNFVFFEKTMANFFHVFIFDKKYLFSTSSFDKQDVPWRHSTNKMYPGSASVECIEINWFRKHMKKVRSSQRAVLVMNWIKQFFPVSFVRDELKTGQVSI